jgi:protein-tyrosine phosphatase
MVRLKDGPVYVHCAAGHGRSAMFVAALLLASGRLASVSEAEAFMREKRPEVRLSSSQRELLDMFLLSRMVNCR